MRKLGLIIAATCLISWNSIAQEKRIIPHQTARFEVITDANEEYAVAWNYYKALIYNKAKAELIAKFEFEAPIRNIVFGDEHIVIQSESDGVLFNLKSMQSKSSAALKGSGACFLPKDKSLYAASSNQEGKEFKNTREILAQQALPNSWLVKFDMDLNIEDSIPLQTVIPGAMTLNGNTLRVDMKPWMRGSAASGNQNAFAKQYLRYEEVNLKTKETSLFNEEVEPVDAPAPINFDLGNDWYGNKNLQLYYDTQSGTLLQYGVGSGSGVSDGGVVKAWQPFDLHFKATLAVGNDLNPLLGFNADGDVIGELWVATDSLMGYEDYAYSDIVFDASGNAMYAKMKTIFDVESLEKKFIQPEDLDLFSAENDYEIEEMNAFEAAPVLRVGNTDFSFDPTSMNFSLASIYDPVNTVRFIVFSGDDWLAVNKEGKWFGTNKAAAQCDFYEGDKLLDSKAVQALKDEAAVKASLKSIREASPTINRIQQKQGR